MTTDATFDIDALAAVARKYDLLQHSFYQRWAAGELTRHELDDYAGQYAHVVAGLPRWLEAAAGADAAHADRLVSHAREESTHVALWDGFTTSVSLDRRVLVDRPNPATAELLRRAAHWCDAGQGAAVAWAVEAQSPEVSATKLSGLAEHYDIDATGGGRYFALHARRDVEHRDELMAVIADGGDVPAAAEAAESVLSAMWDLLTSVERLSA
jgi:pyrroloquinoline-quinone synthase